MRQLDDYLQAEVRNQSFTAATIRVIHKGKVWTKAYGVLDPRFPDHPTQLDSLYDLASVTKVFVATGFMRLVELGKVELHATLSSVLPEFRGKNKERVTFWHLLTHSSGLPASIGKYLYELGEWNQGKEIVAARLASTELVYTPGTSVLYSDPGYMLLGLAMERLMGFRLDEILRQTLFEPLDWHDVLYNPPQSLRPRIAVTALERPNRGELPAGVVHDGSAIALDGISGNAGLFASAEAVAQLGELFLNGTYLSAKTVHEMTTEQIAASGWRRGLGWRLRTTSEKDPIHLLSKDTYTHNGFTGASVTVDPQRQLIVVLLTNCVYHLQAKDETKSLNSTLQAEVLKRILADIG